MHEKQKNKPYNTSLSANCQPNSNSLKQKDHGKNSCLQVPNQQLFPLTIKWRKHQKVQNTEKKGLECLKCLNWLVFLHECKIEDDILGYLLPMKMHSVSFSLLPSYDIKLVTESLTLQ